MKRVNVFTDGASRGNPGSASIGIVINDDDGNEIITHKEFIGKVTNNNAEYSALIKGVKLLKTITNDFDEINFFSDSELMVKQINGQYKVRNPDMIKLSLEFWKEIRSLNKKFSLNHILRDKNKVADRLANEALDEHAAQEHS
ncbi:MAG: ribonuclease HI family protein [Ignavibacteria bacterium]